jgi:DHA3 family macrolide efflux protein-like MFS transporter
MGLIMMAASLPGALLGPFGGTLADNVSRKVIIVTIDVVRGVACVAFVASIKLGSVQTAIAALLVAQIVFGLAGAAFNPALQASIPALVPIARLVSANSLMQGFSRVFQVLSLALGGLLYTLVGAPILFLINGISYFVSGAAASLVHIPQQMPAVPLRFSNAMERFRTDTLAGILYAWSIPGLRKVFLVAAILNFVLIPVTIAQPIFVRDFLHKDAAFLGFCAAANGLGGTLGYLMVGGVHVPDHQRATVFLTANVLFATSLFLIGFTQEPLSALVLFFICGLTLPMANVMVHTVIQANVPSEIRGRVMGVLGTIATGLVPIAMGVSGIAIDLMNQQVPVLWYLCSLVMLVAMIYLSSSADFRSYLNAKLSPE